MVIEREKHVVYWDSNGVLVGFIRIIVTPTKRILCRFNVSLFLGDATIQSEKIQLVGIFHDMSCEFLHWFYLDFLSMKWLIPTKAFGYSTSKHFEVYFDFWSLGQVVCLFPKCLVQTWDTLFHQGLHRTRSHGMSQVWVHLRMNLSTWLKRSPLSHGGFTMFWTYTLSVLAINLFVLGSVNPQSYRCCHDGQY